jgi:hypothetical protein
MVLPVFRDEVDGGVDRADDEGKLGKNCEASKTNEGQASAGFDGVVFHGAA